MFRNNHNQIHIVRIGQVIVPQFIPCKGKPKCGSTKAIAMSLKRFKSTHTGEFRKPKKVKKKNDFVEEYQKSKSLIRNRILV